jgi:hypothetical protein
MEGASDVVPQQGNPSFAQGTAQLLKRMDTIRARAKQSMDLAAALESDPAPSAVGPMEVFQSLAASPRGGKEPKQYITDVLQLLEDIEGRDADHFAKYMAMIGTMMAQLSEH